MNALIIPNHDISQYETFFDKIDFLNKVGLRLSIDKINWTEEYPKSMPVTVDVAHDNQKVYLYYQVHGEELRVVQTEDFMPVFKDSCVEFFIQRKGETKYRNFEFNAHGVLLAYKRESRSSSEQLSKELMSSVERFTTIQHVYKNGVQLSNWTLYAEIPKKALGFSIEEKLSQQAVGANFYKCGDETKEPHYISWNPIDTPSPDFHVPQFFGDLTFE